MKTPVGRAINHGKRRPSMVYRATGKDWRFLEENRTNQRKNQVRALGLEPRTNGLKDCFRVRFSLCLWRFLKNGSEFASGSNRILTEQDAEDSLGV